ncbi:hypothetical protein D3C76_564260 [compost metagenome]
MLLRLAHRFVQFGVLAFRPIGIVEHVHQRAVELPAGPRMGDEGFEQVEHGQRAVVVPQRLQSALGAEPFHLVGIVGAETDVPADRLHDLHRALHAVALRAVVAGQAHAQAFDLLHQFRRQCIDQVAHVADHGFAATGGRLAAEEGDALRIVAHVGHLRMQRQLHRRRQAGRFHHPPADLRARRHAAGIAGLEGREEFHQAGEVGGFPGREAAQDDAAVLDDQLVQQRPATFRPGPEALRILQRRTARLDEQRRPAGTQDVALHVRAQLRRLNGPDTRVHVVHTLSPCCSCRTVWGNQLRKDGSLRSSSRSTAAHSWRPRFFSWPNSDLLVSSASRLGMISSPAAMASTWMRQAHSSQ